MTKHGAPDWSVYRISSTTYTVMDLAEHAARLGSIVTFDRRGDVIFLADFSAGLNQFKAIPGGTGASVTASPAHYLSPGHSAKLTTGNSIGNITAIANILPPPVVSKIGIEFSFVLHDDVQYIHLIVYHYDGVGYYLYQVRIDVQNLKLQIYAHPEGWVDIRTLPPLLSYQSFFYPVKLVFDLMSQTYTRLLFLEEEHDISAYAPASSTSTVAPRLDATLRVSTAVNSNITIYVDNVIITQDEP